MIATFAGEDEFKRLEARLKTLLPEQYQDSYDDVQPVSMGSAGLKYGADGRVAWDEIWGSFCDLAMAGGPPHRGRLLEPAAPAEIELQPGRYAEVVAELCRGIEMVTGLAAEPAAFSGWIQVDCPSRGMAGWLLRAINMENVSAHADGMALYLPAGTAFRVEKEIKNVVTTIAKTCHYWVGHTSVAQHRAIGELFQVMESESPLLQAPFPGDVPESADIVPGFDNVLRDQIAADLLARIGTRATGLEYHGWLGIDVLSVRSAIWMMRMLVASNVVARTEGTLVYVPVNPRTDRKGRIAAGQVARAYRLACARQVA